MSRIHTSAVIAPGASIATDVTIGPYCLVGKDVTLAAGVVLHGHVVIDGTTRIGANTEIFPFACIGKRPQDLKYDGEPSSIEIGADNVIREHVTIHIGTRGGGMCTRVRDGCLLMVGVHIAHDCQVGNRVIISNATGVAGHVEIGDHAVIGGHCGVHQFVRIGNNAMVGGASALASDVPPYCVAVGNRARFAGLNLTGLRRTGMDTAEIDKIRHLCDILYGGRSQEAESPKALLKAQQHEYPPGSPCHRFIEFVTVHSRRGLVSASIDV